MPPGPFFAVWGVVILGSVAAALWGLPLHRATRAPWTAVQVPGVGGPRLNGATLLPGEATAAWALLVVGAALTACIGARLFGGQPAFTLAAGWALLGLVVSTSGAGEPGLAALATAGLAAVAVTAVASRKSTVPA